MLRECSEEYLKNFSEREKWNEEKTLDKKNGSELKGKKFIKNE